jgi:hypothetical protein
MTIQVSTVRGIKTTINGKDSFYITATEARHIKAGLALDVVKWGTKKKEYQIVAVLPGSASVIIEIKTKEGKKWRGGHHAVATVTGLSCTEKLEVISEDDFNNRLYDELKSFYREVTDGLMAMYR